jgi:predicted PurR-regulated permease PerM
MMIRKNSDEKKVNTLKVNDLINTGNKILKVLFVLFIILLVYVISLIFKEWGIMTFIGKIISIISPLFIGFFFAWLLNPLVKRLINKKVNKTFAVIISYLLFLAVIYLVCAFTVPALTEQISDIVAAIPDIVSDVNKWINDLFLKLSNITLQNLDNVKASFLKKITEMASDLQKGLPEMTVNIISGIASGIGNIVLSLILGFYLLFDYDNFCEGFSKLFPKNARKELKVLTSRISTTSYAFIIGTLWLSLLLFIVSIIGFSIIGLNAPVLISFVCVITNLIPYIGPYIGAAVAGAIGFTESPLIGILTLVFILIVQTIDGNLLQPLVMSKKMNLSPITILLSLLVFGYFWGIFGMVIATPLVAIIKIIYEFFDEKYHFFEYKSDENK